MIQIPVVRLSRVSFLTDATNGRAPVVPFARVIESVWPDSIRWVGLLGRTRLTQVELDHINLETWPEFKEPHALLMRLWDCGWGAPWGEAGQAVQRLWTRSALRVEIEELQGLLPESAPSAEATLTGADPILLARMMAEQVHLAPVLIAPVIPLRAYPTAARTETDVLPLAA